MEYIVTIRHIFFDSSALVKLFIKESASDRVRKIFFENHIYTSWIVIAETMSVLKRKMLKGEIDRKNYLENVLLLFTHLKLGKIIVVYIEVTKSDKKLQTFDFDVLNYLRVYNKLDAADVLQFAAIKNIFKNIFAGESRPKLVTADKNMAKAAKKEGIDVIEL